MRSASSNRANRVTWAAVLLAGSFLVPATVRPAQAATAATADDICAPAEDPCVIDETWDVTGILDFGARTVSIVSGGRLRGQVTLRAGAIQINISDGTVVAVGGTGQDVHLEARRSCSGDPATLCLGHSQCPGLGTCSAGNSGTMVLDGTISSSGTDGNDITILASGDIQVAKRLNANASGLGNPSGSVYVESYLGSVSVTGPVSASAAQGVSYDYGAGEPGYIEIYAEVDVTIASEVKTWGPEEGGSTDIAAGRDVFLHGDLMNSSGNGLYASGGRVSVSSGRDTRVVVQPGGDSIPEVGTDGGGQFYFYGYGNEGSWGSGYGGYQELHAGGDLELGLNTRLHSLGGPSAGGGHILVSADGTAEIHGSVLAQGQPPHSGADSGAGGGSIRVIGDQGITLGRTGLLGTASPLGQGFVALSSDGPTVVDGQIDVRGTGSGDYVYANPGTIWINGQTDLTIGGKLRGGGNYWGEDWEFEVCRLHLLSSAVLANTLNNGNSEATGIEMTIGESMRADAKSRIQTDPTVGAATRIYYRDPAKPPVLLGSITPPPLLQAVPALEGCPVCGNLEIDEGESCDDGNTTSGDGCRADCQDEGCVAATPGFPSISLCHDGVECTLDLCNPTTHACEHPVSCDDGIACTLDACNAGSCEHVPSDALCGDGNDCTDDLCNDLAGCVHASLTGNTCEDGDFCTLPGTCESGTCDAGPVTRTLPNQVQAKVFDGDANDRLKLRLDVPGGAFVANPAASGARVVLADDDDVVLHDVVLAAGNWTQIDPTRWAYTSGDARTRATVRVYETTGNARITIKKTDASLSGALGQSWLTASVLFGTEVGVDQCVTARRVPCTTKGSGAKCVN